MVEGQPFSVELRFGWDQGLSGRINSAALSLPWWDDLPGVLALDPPEARPGARQQTLGLNGTDRIVVEELEPQTMRGRPFRAFRLLRSYVPTRSGTLEFPVTYPEDYGAKHLAGKTVAYRLSVHEVKRKVLPPSSVASTAQVITPRTPICMSGPRAPSRRSSRGGSR